MERTDHIAPTTLPPHSISTHTHIRNGVQAPEHAHAKPTDGETSESESKNKDAYVDREEKSASADSSASVAAAMEEAPNPLATLQTSSTGSADTVPVPMTTDVVPITSAASSSPSPSLVEQQQRMQQYNNISQAQQQQSHAAMTRFDRHQAVQAQPAAAMTQSWQRPAYTMPVQQTSMTPSPMFSAPLHIGRALAFPTSFTQVQGRPSSASSSSPSPPSSVLRAYGEALAERPVMARVLPDGASMEPARGTIAARPLPHTMMPVHMRPSTRMHAASPTHYTSSMGYTPVSTTMTAYGSLFAHPMQMRMEESKEALEHHFPIDEAKSQLKQEVEERTSVKLADENVNAARPVESEMKMAEPTHIDHAPMELHPTLLMPMEPVGGMQYVPSHLSGVSLTNGLAAATAFMQTEADVGLALSELVSSNCRLARGYGLMRSAFAEMNSLVQSEIDSSEMEPPQLLFTLQTILQETEARDRELAALQGEIEETAAAPTSEGVAVEPVTTQPTERRAVRRSTRTRVKKPTTQSRKPAVATSTTDGDGSVEHEQMEALLSNESAAAQFLHSLATLPTSSADHEATAATKSLPRLSRSRSVRTAASSGDIHPRRKAIIHTLTKRADAVEHGYGTRATNRTVRFVLSSGSPSPSPSPSPPLSVSPTPSHTIQHVDEESESESEADSEGVEEEAVMLEQLQGAGRQQEVIHEEGEGSDEEFIEPSSRKRQCTRARSTTLLLKSDAGVAPLPLPSIPSPKKSTPLIGHHAMTAISNRISRYPLLTCYIQVAQMWTVGKVEARHMSKEEQNKLVLVPVRFMVTDPPYRVMGPAAKLTEEDIFVVAKDVSILIHKRKGSVAKSIYNFDEREKVRVHACSRPREAGRGSGVVGGGASMSGGGASTTGLSTQVLTVLSHCGIERLMHHSRSVLAPHVLRWVNQQYLRIINTASILKDHEQRSQQMETIKHMPAAQAKAEEERLLRMEEEEELDVFDGFEHLAGVGDEIDDEEEDESGSTASDIVGVIHSPSTRRSMKRRNSTTPCLQSAQANVKRYKVPPRRASAPDTLTQQPMVAQVQPTQFPSNRIVEAAVEKSDASSPPPPMSPSTSPSGASSESISPTLPLHGQALPSSNRPIAMIEGSNALDNAAADGGGSAANQGIAPILSHPTHRDASYVALHPGESALPLPPSRPSVALAYADAAMHQHMNLPPIAHAHPSHPAQATSHTWMTHRTQTLINNEKDSNEQKYHPSHTVTHFNKQEQ